MSADKARLSQPALPLEEAIAAEANNGPESLRKRLKTNAQQVEDLMDALLPVVAGPENRVLEAMRYACFSGGKRIRPFLVRTSAELFKVPMAYALRAAAAVEFVHCYSLVHDDLPSMDDSELRRGKPTVHKQFDEAIAILVGDSLIPLAFEVLSNPLTHKDPSIRADLCLGLSKAIGGLGMVAGQALDIMGEKITFDLETITRMQDLKTGACIKFACEAGAILGNADKQKRTALSNYGAAIGLAFQITDDLLDIEGDSTQTGKPALDQDANKSNFVSILGIDEAKKRAKQTTENAIDALSIFDDRANILRELALYILNRKK